MTIKITKLTIVQIRCFHFFRIVNKIIKIKNGMSNKYKSVIFQILLNVKISLDNSVVKFFNLFSLLPLKAQIIMVIAANKYTQWFVHTLPNFQYISEQIVEINYINTKLNIGLKDWQTAWVLGKPYPTKLTTETYRGALVFRLWALQNGLVFQT
jgi:hypothetical protein